MTEIVFVPDAMWHTKDMINIDLWLREARGDVSAFRRMARLDYWSLSGGSPGRIDWRLAGMDMINKRRMIEIVREDMLSGEHPIPNQTHENRNRIQTPAHDQSTLRHEAGKL